MAQSTPSLNGSDAIYYAHSSAATTAPAEKTWQTLIDTSTWPSWNSFCPRVTIRHQPGQDELSSTLQNGTQMTLHVHMDRNSPAETDVHLVVTQFEPPDSATNKTGRIAWSSDYTASGTLPRFLLQAERVHEIKPVDEGRGSEVRNWEVQVGYAAYAVRWMYGRVVQEAFERWVEDLGRYVSLGSA